MRSRGAKNPSYVAAWPFRIVMMGGGSAKLGVGALIKIVSKLLIRLFGNFGHMFVMSLLVFEVGVFELLFDGPGPLRPKHCEQHRHHKTTK